MTKPEVKVQTWTEDLGQIAVGTTTVYLTTLIGQGAGDKQRIGDRISVVSISFSAICFQPVIARSYASYLRFVIVHDKRYNGTSLSGSDLLVSYEAINNSWHNYNSDYNNSIVNDIYERGKSVDILMDKKIYFSTCTVEAPDNSVALDKQTGTISFRRKYKVPKVVNYNGSSNKTGQIYMMIFSGPSDTVAENPFYSYAFYAYYTDC